MTDGLLPVNGVLIVGGASIGLVTSVRGRPLPRALLGVRSVAYGVSLLSSLPALVSRAAPARWSVPLMRLPGSGTRETPLLPPVLLPPVPCEVLPAAGFAIAFVDAAAPLLATLRVSLLVLLLYTVAGPRGAARC